MTNTLGRAQTPMRVRTNHPSRPGDLRRPTGPVRPVKRPLEPRASDLTTLDLKTLDLKTLGSAGAVIATAPWCGSRTGCGRR